MSFVKKMNLATVAMMAVCSMHGKVFASEFSRAATTMYSMHPLVGMAFCEHYSSQLNTLEANTINRHLNIQMPQIWDAFKPKFMAELQVRTLAEMKNMVVQNMEIGFKKQMGSSSSFADLLKNNPNLANTVMADCMRNLLVK